MSDVIRSCDTCPAFISALDSAGQRAALGKFVGAAVCGRHKKILELPNEAPETRKASRIQFAVECSEYGEPYELPTRSPSLAPVFTEQVFEVFVENPFAVPDEISEPSTCTECVYYLPMVAVHGIWGLGAGVCVKSGELVLNTFKAPGRCGNGVVLDATQEMSSWVLPQPEYLTPLDVYIQRESDIGDLVVKAACSHIDLSQDPNSYVSDAPLSQEDKDMGLRAWRRVSDPKGVGKDIFLPIFDAASLSEDERAKIPALGGDEHPEEYLDYNGLFYGFGVEALELDETPLLQGAPGLGKTEFARALAYATNLPFERVVFRQRMDADALLGSPQYDPDKGTYFQPGTLPQAWSKPCVLLLDEPNLAEDDDVLHVLRPLTDNSKQLVIEGASGDGQRGSWRFPRHPLCLMLLAQNPSWDSRNLGTREFASADANRLSVLNIQDPPESILRSIIIKRCSHDGYDLDGELLATILKISQDIAELSKDGAFPDHWGTRQIIKVARKTRFYGLTDAFRKAALDLYSPEIVDLVVSIIDTHTRTEADQDAENAFTSAMDM